MNRKKNKKAATSREKAAAPARPAGKAARFLIAGIGASAGGLSAFEAFFSGLTPETASGMALVLVQHLAPDHKSILAELLRRCTSMQVLEAEDGMPVRPGCAYIIPPNRDMSFANGALRLFAPARVAGPRLPIDFLFRSLAEGLGERAVGIVLSGTGSDGTLGVRAIKGEGGMVMAQSPATAEYDGMPNSAIATGLVDFVLPPAEMAAQLLAYSKRALAAGAHGAFPESPGDKELIKKIFALLRVRTGNDFSQYKQNTINRRIARRMAVRQAHTLAAYVQYLQKNPAEIDALFGDLLIGVTRFFRDPKEFNALAETLAGQVIAGKPEGGTIRAWVPGCSTGEEAYSLAIMLAERLEKQGQGLQAQVFATDIDRQAIETARTGIYPAGIAEDVSPERLARFFSAEPGGLSYRINKSIRDMLVFSEQNVLKDPPFSRLDLISCRNLLIYLSGELQERLLPLFHYALNPGGLLFLGTAEGMGASERFFTPLNQKDRIFRRRELAAGTDIPGLGQYAPPPAAAPGLAHSGLFTRPRKPPLREAAERALLQRRGLAAALTDERGGVLYLHGRSGRYLEPPPGEGGMNILSMAREGLRTPLASALKASAAKNETVTQAGLRVKTNGDFSRVNLTVQPVKDAPEAGQRLFLVVLEPAAAPAGEAAGNAPAPAGPDERVTALQEELRLKEESLQAVNQELSSFNQELMASNEELQSTNEELQSSNEELATSREELQSVNEELATVNAELQAKVAELSRSSNDMVNLMSCTGISTIFVDQKLRIQRFTPAATKLVNLIDGDRGRPLSHIVSNLAGYAGLTEDARQVLDTLAPLEREVQTKDGAWFLLRIRPYRTSGNVIEGATITFVDITDLKRAQEAMRRLAIVLQDAHDAVTVVDLGGRVLAWNPAAEKGYGWSEQQALGMNIRDMIPPAMRRAALDRLKRLGQEKTLSPYRASRIHKDGHIVQAWVTATALQDQSGAVYAISTTERVIESK